MYTQIFLKILIGFISLFIVVKVVGKTQISEISPFHFITAVILGELLGNAIYDPDVGISHVVFTIFSWTLLMYIVEIIGLRRLDVRSFLLGNPSLLVRNGKIDRAELKKNKMEVNQLLYMLRVKGVFSIREVEYVLLEPDGDISILKKSDYATPTKSDMNLPKEAVNLPTPLIDDGKVLWNNLEMLGYNQDWLKEQLNTFGVGKIEDVFYAEWLPEKGLYVSRINRL